MHLFSLLLFEIAFPSKPERSSSSNHIICHELLFKSGPFSFVISTDKVNDTFVYQAQCFSEGGTQILLNFDKRE